MGNSATKNRKRTTKKKSISDIETARTGRQDFSTSHTLTGDIPLTEEIPEAQIPIEEDIIIKCNLEEMTKSFFQDYVIVWHDPNINSQENQQYIVQLKKFCDVLTFTEWQKAKDYIQSTPTTCHVVTSGTDGELLIKEVDQLQSVINIYIFCRSKDYHSSWAKNYSKVSCIETNIQSLLSQIQHNLLQWYKQASSLKLNLPAFAPFFNETDKSQMNNLHRFLKVIPNFQNRFQAKNDFVNLSKAIYADKLISEFEQNYNEYNKDQTLKWYSQESFLYKVTNNCLRVATCDSIQYSRLLLQDIQRAIKEQYQTKSKNFNGLLYRGAYLSEKEWSNLKENLNREIEMHGFLSVSKVKNIGLNFMKADPSKKVFITIIVPQGPNQEEQGFAEIHEFSQFPQEKEVLFNVRSRFTILETEDEGPYRHLVLLYGAQGFRKFLSDKNPMIEVPIPKAGLVSCNRCKIPKRDKIFFISLVDPQKQIYYCQECIDSQFAPFLYIPPTNKEAFTARISGFLLTNSQKSETPFYGYKCSSFSSKECQAKKQKQYFFTCTECHLQWCQNCFENYHNSTHNIILETSPFNLWYQPLSKSESLHIKSQNELFSIKNNIFQQAQMYSNCFLYEKAIEYYNIFIQQNKAKDQKLAISYNNLGLVFQEQGEGQKALEYYLKSAEIEVSIPGDNRFFIAAIYCNIGHVYDNLKEFDKALEYHFKSLNISKSLSAGIYTSYIDIGQVYHHKGEEMKALEFYEKSLEMIKSAYGDQHPDLWLVWNSIGKVFFEQGEYKKALEYYFKSLDIAKSVNGDNHPDTAISFNDIGEALLKQGEHNKALEYFLLSLDINKSFYKDNHPRIGLSLQNIGQTFWQRGEYDKAVEYSLKSIDIFKLVYGENYPGNAAPYNTAGLALFYQGDSMKALEYFLKALNLCKGVVERDSQLETATSYQNLALIYNQQEEYEKALECCLKSLDIAEQIYGENHPTTGTLYNNIGFIYYNQGEDSKALEFSEKALNIAKSVYGDYHPEIARIYQNLGLIYEHQREDSKALESFFKSLESCGEKHSIAATSYDHIGLIYNKQGEHKKALEYCLKSLDYGENHPETGTFCNHIGFIYFSQGEYSKALEYFFKALDISKSVYGSHHPVIAASYTNIGSVYDLQGDSKKALEYSLKAFDVSKAVYGDSHPEMIPAYQDTGMVYYCQGEYRKALEYFLPCLEIQKSFYGDNHPNTIFTQEKIFEVQSKLTTDQ